MANVIEKILRNRTYYIVKYLTYDHVKLLRWVFSAYRTLEDAEKFSEFVYDQELTLIEDVLEKMDKQSRFN